MLQHIINFVYRHPKAKLKIYRRFGGYINYRKMLWESERMKLKSSALPPVQSYDDGLSVYFLTGKKYLYQTLFCIQSLIRHSSERFSFVLVDDGSFDDRLTAQIAKQLPGSRIITAATIAQNLQVTLPENSYPHLRYKRTVYPHLKKLTDIHTIPGNSWKLVLDSDMLFWNNPTAMITWLKEPHQPLHMVDSVDAYGYSKLLMEGLRGCKIRPLINVGAIGLNSDLVSWDKLEYWLKELEEKEGKTYYLEQALSAMLIGDSKSTVLNADEYVVNPVKNTKGILHHYVDLSKAFYFKIAWKQFI